MALVPCRECGVQISSEAPSCPRCGAPDPTPQRGLCVGCGNEIEVLPLGECPQCGVIEPFRHARYGADVSGGSGPSRKMESDDVTAGCLGLLLGPVGLWYKGHWPAGFAWLAMTVLLGIASAGWLLPFLWIGMAIHAAAADRANG
mgnify:CR=1 FL=1